MGKRLYYGYLARATRYSPEYEGHAAQFVFQLQINYSIEGVYKAPTFEAIIEQLKAKGYQIWGHDILDYAIPPRNALEYKLMEAYMQKQGYSAEDIAEAFSLYIEQKDNDV